MQGLMDDLISRRAAIDTEGLDAQIRCEMCRNPMHTDRGCDGNCKYDEKLYEKIMQILNERIKPLPSVQPDRYTIDCILYNLYNQLSNRCGTGAMVGCKDWIEQLYEEIFGKGMRPIWMT